MASIDAFVSDEVGLFKAGYRHFHLDDCWADLERNASGFLQAERGAPGSIHPTLCFFR